MPLQVFKVGVPSLEWYIAEEAKFFDITDDLPQESVIKTIFPSTGKVTMTTVWEKPSITKCRFKITALGFGLSVPRVGDLITGILHLPPDHYGKQETWTFHEARVVRSKWSLGDKEVETCKVVMEFPEAFLVKVKE